MPAGGLACKTFIRTIAATPLPPGITPPTATYLGTLMGVYGWKSVAMALRYAHVNAGAVAPGVMRIGEGTTMSAPEEGRSRH